MLEGNIQLLSSTVADLDDAIDQQINDAVEMMHATNESSMEDISRCVSDFTYHTIKYMYAVHLYEISSYLH